ncbi:hypothetical protein ACVWW4_006531 [Bradyrhizobium sp. LB7.1]
MPSSPTRFATGTRTSSKNTWLTSWSPPMVRMGRVVMPGAFMSIRTKLMPSCCRGPSLVRTSANMRLA